MFKATFALAGVAMGCLSLPAGASTLTLTFPTTADCTAPGITITQGPDAAACVGAMTPNNTEGLVASGTDTSYWTARFLHPVSEVAVDLGDFGADDDVIFIAAYGIDDTMLGALFTAVDGSDATMHTLDFLNGMKGISWVVFGTQGGLGGIYADNLTYSAGPASVPLPATGGMLGVGMLVLVALRRRNSLAGLRAA